MTSLPKRPCLNSKRLIARIMTQSHKVEPACGTGNELPLHGVIMILPPESKFWFVIVEVPIRNKYITHERCSNSPVCDDSCAEKQCYQQELPTILIGIILALTWVRRGEQWTWPFHLPSNQRGVCIWGESFDFYPSVIFEGMSGTASSFIHTMTCK